MLRRSRSANDVTRFTELAFRATITAFRKSGIWELIVVVLSIQIYIIIYNIVDIMFIR